jgi:energy-coupling factor transporter ATP-binding protein EcfA2
MEDMPLAKRLEHLDIEGLRGIRRASIGPLADLNLFVGKNNCGKTTVLESLLVLTLGAQDPVPDQASRLYLNNWRERRGESRDGLRMTGLLRDSKESLRITPRGWGNASRGVLVEPTGSVQPRGEDAHLAQFVADMRAFHPQDGFDARIEHGLWPVVLANRWDRTLVSALKTVFGVDVEQVHLLNDRAHLLTPAQGRPVDVWGDGTRLLFRALLVLLATSEAPFLLEEPECHQHPGSLRRYAQAIVDLARTNRVQLFIATHSDECLKAFVEACGTQTGDDRMEAAIFHLRRSDEGDVTTTRIAPSVLEGLTEQHVDVRNLDLYE